MTRPIRYCPYPFTLFEITTRTLQSRFLLKPSPELNEIVLGILGRALALYPDIKLHCFVFLSNHYHMLLSCPDTERMSKFMGFLNGNLAKEAGRLAEWREKLWSRRFQAIPVLDDEKMRERIRYICAHGVKENLVSDPGLWPGAHCIHALTKGEKLRGVWFDRTAEYNARRRGISFDKYEFSTTYEVPLTPFPGWEGMEEPQRQHEIRKMVDEITAENRARMEQEGKQPLGTHEVTLQGPHQQPLQTSKRPAPLCHTSIGTMRKGFRKLYREFVGNFRDAVERIRSGESAVRFPSASFPPALAYVGWSAPQLAEYAGSRAREPFPYALGI